VVENAVEEDLGGGAGLATQCPVDATKVGTYRAAVGFSEVAVGFGKRLGEGAFGNETEGEVVGSSKRWQALNRAEHMSGGAGYED
jgi:hypothetical protein